VELRHRLAICWLVGALSLPAATGLIGSAGGCGAHLESEVEVVDETGNSKRFTGGFDSDNKFRFPDLPPGQYSIRVNGRDPARHARILPGVLTDTGALFVCVGSPERVKTEDTDLGRYWKIDLTELCAVNLTEPGWCIADIGRSGPIQPFDDGRRVFWFHTAADGAYLIPFRDVSFSLNPVLTNSDRGCPGAVYLQGRMRIDDLPGGSRACVRSTRGGYFELRFPQKFAPGQNTTVELLALGN
jgi:hypothetical protein